MQPLEELSFICLPVKQGLCLIELVERLPALTFIMNSPRKKKSSPNQEEEVMIVKSQPLQSQDLAINSKSSIPKNPQKGEEILPLEILVEIKDDLFGADFGRALNSHKRPSSEYNSNYLKKGSLRKRPYSHVGY